MAIRINKKITGYSVARDDAPAADNTPAPRADAAHQDSASDDDGGAEIIHMHERVERPDRLEGHTYKIKSPLFEHALYVTINDIVLNQDTEHELRRPYEIFVNSKNMEHFQWMVALTRIMSAVFRKGGDVTFLVEELKAVFDPRGGAWMEGRYVPSLLAAIGGVIERHMIEIGFLQPQQGDASMAAGARRLAAPPSAGLGQCPRCGSLSLLRQEGCDLCTACGYSHCG